MSCATKTDRNNINIICSLSEQKGEITGKHGSQIKKNLVVLYLTNYEKYTLQSNKLRAALEHIVHFKISFKENMNFMTLSRS